jgi:hypothetical protein
MILQTDPGLPEIVNLGGCHGRSLLAIAEFWTGAELALEQVNTAFEWAMQDPLIMKGDCTMGRDLHRLINYGFRLLGHEKPKAAQIGIVDPGAKFEFWASTGVYTILKGLLHEVGYKGRKTPTFHFRLGDRTGGLLFDPAGALPIIREESTLIYMVRAA